MVIEACSSRLNNQQAVLGSNIVRIVLVHYWYRYKYSSSMACDTTEVLK